MTMLFFSLEVAPMSEGDSFTGSGAAARGVRGGLGGHMLGDWERHRMRFLVLWGALLPFVLRACCGSMCWPGGPASHACRRRSGCTRG